MEEEVVSPTMEGWGDERVGEDTVREDTVVIYCLVSFKIGR